MAATQGPMQQLELVKEAKLFDVLGGRLDPRLEASGVLAMDGLFYVIFDNLPHIACVGAELSAAAAANHVIEHDRGHRRGFEDIAHDSRNGRFYVLIESLPRARGKFMAAVQEYDINFGYIGTAWLDFPLDRPNKGLEGLTCVHRQGRTYLLGLCEGNRCQGGGGRPRSRGRADPRVPARTPPLGPRGQDPAAGNGPVRGLQRHRGERRPDRGCISGLIGAVGWQPRAIQLAGHGRRHELRAPETCRRRHPVRHGRGGVMDSTGPGGHGLGQGQTRTGPPLPGQGSVDPHLPYPCSGQPTRPARAAGSGWRPFGRRWG